MDDDPKAEAHLIESIRLAMDNVRRRTNAPFGAVVTRQGKIVARAVNQVDDLCDPTAHAEMQAVRAAAKALNSTDLSGCTVYASGYPCPMCLTAMYLSGVRESLLRLFQRGRRALWAFRRTRLCRNRAPAGPARDEAAGASRARRRRRPLRSLEQDRAGRSVSAERPRQPMPAKLTANTSVRRVQCGLRSSPHTPR